MNLNLFDCMVIVSYLLILVGIGVYLKKRASSSIENYFLGGRKMPWWALGISSMSAWIDLTGTMVIVSFIYLLGPRGLFVEFRGGACLVLVILMIWTGKWHRRSGVMTAAEWMIYRFGNNPWGVFARFTAVFSAVIYTIGTLALIFKGMGLFLAMFLPFTPFTCAVIMIVVTALYTLESGFYGVIITDMFQSILLWIGIAYIVILAVSKITDFQSFAVMAASVTGTKDWVSTVPSWKVSLPPGYQDYTFLLALGGFYFFKSVFQGMSIGADPKFFGARNDKECGLQGFMCGWMMMLRWPLIMGISILGIFMVRDLFPDHDVLVQAAEIIKYYFPQISQSLWTTTISNIINTPEAYPIDLVQSLQNILGTNWKLKLNLLSYQGTVDPERILPGVLLFHIPAGVRGLILVGLVSGSMSTINAMLNSTTAFLTRDVYQGYIRTTANNRELIAASYVFTALIAAVSLLMAYFTPTINTIWGWMMGGLSGGIIAPTFLRFYWWRFNGGGFAVGTIVGILAALIQYAFFPATEWQQFFAIVAISTIACIVGTYLTQPTDRKVLENFYATTRPFGLWKPLKCVLSTELLKETNREHLYDIAAAPFGFGWLITILFMPMQLMIGNRNGFFITLAIFMISCVGLYFLWFKQLSRLDTVKSRLQKEQADSVMVV